METGCSTSSGPGASITRKEWPSSEWMRVCAASAASFCVRKNAKNDGEVGPAHDQPSAPGNPTKCMHVSSKTPNTYIRQRHACKTDSQRLRQGIQTWHSECTMSGGAPPRMWCCSRAMAASASRTRCAQKSMLSTLEPARTQRPALRHTHNKFTTSTHQVHALAAPLFCAGACLGPECQHCHPLPKFTSAPELPLH